jgi:LPXTG-site transpeptidase (sortase) family protein
VVIADQLPAGFIYNNDASVVLNGVPYAITPTVSVPNDGSAQVNLTWTFGDIYKDASDMVITYSARVADVTGNSLGDVMINNASLDHDYADGTPAPQLTDQESSTITEPVLATVKDVSPTSGVAAGDSLTYTVRFTNTGTSTAFEVTALDTLAQGMAYDAGSAACVYDYTGTGSGAIAVIVTDNGDGTLTFSGNPADAWDIPASDPDSYIECTYTATAQPGIFLDGLHTNTIDADWSSQNGTQPNERDYDDSLSRPGVDETPGADDDDASFTTEGASISKSDGGVTQVVIGQTVHITLTITVPLGTLQDTVIIDTLPAGLIYYDDGLGGSQAISGIVPETGSPGFSYSVPNDGSAAVTLTWDLGAAEVTNSTVIITYDAIIANVAGNYDDMIPGSPDLVNEVHLYYTDVSGTPQDRSDSDSFDVVEADLLVDKTHAAFAVVPDAGDEVHYIVTISPSAASHASAYDVVFTDILPADVRLDLTGHSIIVTPVGDAGWTGSVSIDTSASSEAGNTVEVTVSDIPYTAGTSVQIEYWAIVENTVTPAQLIENTGSLTWTSTSGTNSNERGGTGGGPNTYNTSDTDSFTIHDPSFSKSVYPGSNLDYAIGETVTFSLEVTLPEGTTPSLSILDELPPGLQYVDGSVSMDRTGFAGSVPDPTIVPTLPIGSGTDVRFDFGSTEVDADNDPTNNTFSVRFQAVVLNEADNQQSPPPLDNSATTTVFDDASPTPNVVWTGSDTASINIIEPVLTIGKAANDIYPGADQVVTFTLTVQHDPTSNSDAFDVLVFDDLPADLTLNLASVSVTLGGTATGYTNTSHDNRVEVTVDSIPDDGSTVTIEFTATVSSSVTLTQVITNTATTTWTSTPGTNGDERIGTGGGANDYNASVSIDLTIQKSLSKIVVPDSDSLGTTLLPQMAIGEILTYQIEFHVPVGTTTGVVVTDSLDLGLAYVDCLGITPSPDISTTIVGGFTTICNSATVSAIVDPADPTNPAGAGRQVVFNFGDLTNSSGNIGLITLQYRVVVLDVEENQETTTNLNNSVHLDWSAGPLVTESTEPLNIVEPDLSLLKTADVSIAPPGAAITFTLTIEHTAISTENAYDVILEDVVPPGLEYIPGTLLYVSGIAPTLLDESLAPTLRITWGELPLTPSDPTVIQFQASMGNITPGTRVSNEASVEWSSMPGDLSAPQSVHNVRSTERRYDPLSTIDLYYVTSNVSIGRPALPDTGFAPGVVTKLPPLSMENRTQNLGDLWLEIPSLGIEMPIVGVPMSTEGWDLTWLGDQAGYLEGTAFPTAEGNTGLTGHVYLPNGQPGPFADLYRLTWGQKIIVHFNNMQYIYKVQSVRRVWPDDLSVLNHMDAPTLTLITCQGYDQENDNYWYRIAVQAILADVLPENQGSVYDLGR